MKTLLTEKEKSDAIDRRNAEQEKMTKFYFRRNSRDKLAEIALPTSLKGSTTLEAAVITAYKVADLMLEESDKFKP